MVMAAVDDLLISSRIRATANAVGTPMTVVRRRNALIDAVRAQRPSLVIFDLDYAAIEPVAVIREIRSDPELSGVRLIGFASHVHGELLQAAREAGCDRVLARSGFVVALPDLLKSATGWSPA
jgi:CheY-like chemotaxis protein